MTDPADRIAANQPEAARTARAISDCTVTFRDADALSGTITRGNIHLEWLFTTRAGGVSHAPYDSLNFGDHVGDNPDDVAINRQRLNDLLHSDIAPIHFMDQVHSTVVTTIDAATAPRPVKGALTATEQHTNQHSHVTDHCDALVTADPGVGLAVQVADCIPLLFADPVTGSVAAAHAGRQGVVNGIAHETLAALQELGCNTQDLIVIIGPCARACCYEVPQAMVEEVAVTYPMMVATTRKNTPSLDLVAGIRAQLTNAGVKADRIIDTGICTIDDERFFSYRRANKTGRLAGVIGCARTPVGAE